MNPFPIVAYGATVLKQKAKEVSLDDPALPELIERMWITMYASSGVGLAAPQIGRSLRLFVVDGSPFSEDESLSEEEAEALQDFKEVFINPTLIEETGTPWVFNEGCLSIPGIREDVSRKETIRIEYYDANLKLQKRQLDGLAARIVQHEYDHIEGVLFTDHLSPLKKRLLKGRLQNIAKGNVEADYPMRFPNQIK
jgi:peptide deformylase